MVELVVAFLRVIAGGLNSTTEAIRPPVGTPEKHTNQQAKQWVFQISKFLSESYLHRECQRSWQNVMYIQEPKCCCVEMFSKTKFTD